MVYEMDMEETPLPEDAPVGEPSETDTTEQEQDDTQDEDLDED